MKTNHQDNQPVLPRRDNVLWFLGCVVFFDALSFGFIAPVLPDLIQSLSAVHGAQATVVAGYMIVSYGSMQFVFAPVLGAISDRFGRKPVLIVSLFGFAANYFLMAVATSFTGLVLARLLSGVCGATQSVANACIVDLTAPADRAKIFAYMSAVAAAGFLIGPVLGGLLAGISLRSPFALACIVAASISIAGLLKFPETLEKSERNRTDWRYTNPVTGLLDLCTFPTVKTLLAVLCFISIASHAYSSIWAFYVSVLLGWGPSLIGLSIAFYALMTIVVQVFLTELAVRKLGEKRCAIIAMFLGIITYSGLAVAKSGIAVYSLIFLGSFSSLGLPALQSLLTKSIPEHLQGGAQGVVTAFFSLTAILGALLMTQMFAYFADSSIFFGPGAPFAVSTIVIGFALFLLLRL